MKSTSDATVVTNPRDFSEVVLGTDAFSGQSFFTRPLPSRSLSSLAHEEVEDICREGGHYDTDTTYYTLEGDNNLQEAQTRKKMNFVEKSSNFASKQILLEESDSRNDSNAIFWIKLPVMQDMNKNARHQSNCFISLIRRWRNWRRRQNLKCVQFVTDGLDNKSNSGITFLSGRAEVEIGKGQKCPSAEKLNSGQQTDKNARRKGRNTPASSEVCKGHDLAEESSHFPDANEIDAQLQSQTCFPFSGNPFSRLQTEMRTESPLLTQPTSYLELIKKELNIAYEKAIKEGTEKNRKYTSTYVARYCCID